MAIRGFSVKQPMSKRDRRTALVGWGMGAFVALGAYVGALQFYPSAPSMPMTASVPNGVDMIQTGSIGTSAADRFNALSHNALPGMPLQAQIDSIKIELASMREAIAAAQSGSVSTNRRLQDIEQSVSLVTASIGEASDMQMSSGPQPLPQALDGRADFAIAQPSNNAAPRIVLPAPTEVDGGAVAITMRPMDVSGILTDTRVEAPVDGMQENDVSDDDLTTASIPSQEDVMPADDDLPEAMLVSQTPFAVDIGGAATLEGIDILWRERNDIYSTVLQGLTPRILLQQTSDGSLDLRLVAGPIEDAADAAILCARLVASGLQRCLPAIYDGQQLALR